MSGNEAGLLEKERKIRRETNARIKRMNEKARQAETEREELQYEYFRQYRAQHRTFVPKQLTRIPQQYNDSAPQSLEQRMQSDFERYLRNVYQYASMDLSYLRPQAPYDLPPASTKEDAYERDRRDETAANKDGSEPEHKVGVAVSKGGASVEQAGTKKPTKSKKQTPFVDSRFKSEQRQLYVYVEDITRYEGGLEARLYEIDQRVGELRAQAAAGFGGISAIDNAGDVVRPYMPEDSSIFASQAITYNGPVGGDSDLQGLIDKLNNLPYIEDDDVNYTAEEKCTIRDERLRLQKLIKYFYSRLIMNRAKEGRIRDYLKFIDPTAYRNRPLKSKPAEGRPKVATQTSYPVTNDDIMLSSGDIDEIQSVLARPHGVMEVADYDLLNYVLRGEETAQYATNLPKTHAVYLYENDNGIGKRNSAIAINDASSEGAIDGYNDIYMYMYDANDADEDYDFTGL